MPYLNITDIFTDYKDLFMSANVYYYATRNTVQVMYPPSSLGTARLDAPSITPYLITGPLHAENQRDIMLTWGLTFDGKVRESTLDAGVLNYVEKYVRTAGNAKPGLYCYNFCLTTDPFQYQPSGAINLNKFKDIAFEYTTCAPPVDHEAQTFTICDSSGDIIGINKPVWRLYKYNYNMYVMEERYNLLTFESGTANLMYAR